MLKGKKMILKRLSISKKGNPVVEMVVVLVLVLVFSLIGMFAFKTFQSVYDERHDLFTSNESLQVMEDMNTRLPSAIDGWVVFLLVGLWVATLVFAFMVETHPIFFILGILLLIFCLVGIGFLQNFYTEYFASDSELYHLSYDFPLTTWIFNNLFLIGLFIGLTILLSLYAKTKMS
jgi:hypothetical protein